MVYIRENVILGQSVTFSVHCFANLSSTGVSDEEPLLQVENNVCPERHWSDLCSALSIEAPGYGELFFVVVVCTLE